MESANLPTEKAKEPTEDARQPQFKSAFESRKKLRVTLSEATQSSEKSASQTTVMSYKDILSQAPPELTHRQRMQWLQQRRQPGLWAKCDSCCKWRYLPHVLDSHELPDKWICSLNPDSTAADCSIPEEPIRIHDEEDMIHGEYAAGSLVWARLKGYPWWPAMVDDCPDVEQYYWLDGFSDIPTHYNVVFFDSADVTRAWVATDHLKPFCSKTKLPKNLSNQYRSRLIAAIAQANNAANLTLKNRLAKYSFLAKYTGAINSPKKISKNELRKFQNKLKRQYDIDFFHDDDVSDDEFAGTKKSKPMEISNKTEIKRRNVMLVGSPSSSKPKAGTGSRNESNKKKLTDDVQAVPVGTERNLSDDLKETVIEVPTDDPEILTQPDSMAVQVGSTTPSALASNSLAFDDDTSKTYVPEGDASENTTLLTEGTTVRSTLQTQLQSTVEDGRTTPGSGDFEF